MASPTQWTWVWASSGRSWRTGKPGMLSSMWVQRVGRDWVTEQQRLCALGQVVLLLCVLDVSSEIEMTAGLPPLVVGGLNEWAWVGGCSAERPAQREPHRCWLIPRLAQLSGGRTAARRPGTQQPKNSDRAEGWACGSRVGPSYKGTWRNFWGWQKGSVSWLWWRLPWCKLKKKTTQTILSLITPFHVSAQAVWPPDVCAHAESARLILRLWAISSPTPLCVRVFALASVTVSINAPGTVYVAVCLERRERNRRATWFTCLCLKIALERHMRKCLS